MLTWTTCACHAYREAIEEITRRISFAIVYLVYTTAISPHAVDLAVSFVIQHVELIALPGCGCVTLQFHHYIADDFFSLITSI